MMPARFQALDGWRGIAALMVALFHAPFYGPLYSNALVRHSYLWVDFFFVLSGFVITHATVGKLGSGGDTAAFLIRRFGRVWPLHVAVLAIFVGLELAKWAGSRGGIVLQHPPFTGTHDVGAIFANLALVQALGLFPFTTWNDPAWSICVEFWTYIVFALIVFALPRRTFGIAVAICAASGALLVYLSAKREFSELTYDFGLLRCLFGFFLGHLAYRLATARPFQGSRSGVAAAELVALAGAIGFVCAAGDLLPPAAGAVVFAGAIYIFAAERSFVSRLLRSPPAAWLGTWSYSIYMTHLLVLTVLLEFCHGIEKAIHLGLLARAPGGDPDLVVVALPGSAWWTAAATIAYLALTLAVSALVYRWIETPGRAAFGRYARDWTPGLPAMRRTRAVESSG